MYTASTEKLKFRSGYPETLPNVVLDKTKKRSLMSQSAFRRNRAITQQL